MNARQLFSALFVCTLLLSACTSNNAEVREPMQSVSIAYAEPITDYSPLGYSAANRKYLADVYEPLLAFDKRFNFETKLAVSWGRLDDLTWDFRLRQGVYFHDGREMTAEDVLYSLEKARESEGLSSLLSGVTRIEKVDDYRVHILTKNPDPLLLNKLTAIYVFPDGYDSFLTPVGTGPYQIAGFEEDTLLLQRFEPYWGPLPYFEEARLVYMPEIESRIQALESGQVHMLGNVPPQSVLRLEAAGSEVLDFPSLEVSYLMFNVGEGKYLADERLREGLWVALQGDYVSTLGGGYLRPVTQFAPSGIEGYFADLEVEAIDEKQALFYLQDYGPFDLTLDLPLGLDPLGEAMAEDLAPYGVNLKLNMISPEQYEEYILSGDSDLYFFGWRYSLGDSADFYESVLHSSQLQYGAFNGMNYENERVDEWIEAAAVELQIEKRRELLGLLTEALLEDEVVLPLFESQLLYGVHPSVAWDIRLDGQILASEIVENVLQ